MEYFLHLIILAGIYVILAISLNVIAGYTGLLSIAQAAFYGVGAYTVALMALKLHSPFLVNLLCAMILSGLLGVMVAILVSVAGFYYVADSLRGESFSLEGKVKSHLLVLGALIFLLIAAGHWLGRYDLLYSPTGAVYGIGFRMYINTARINE